MLEPTRGGGGSVRVRLPVNLTPVAQVRGEDIQPGHTTALGGILIFDDEVEIGAILADCLQPLGIETVLANDVVPKLRPDLVICDQKMPGDDGLSLIRWLRAESHAAVLMLTGMILALDREGELDMGADADLPKPFEPAELRSRIKAVLRRAMAAALATGRPAERTRIGRCVVDLDQTTMFDENGDQMALTSMEIDLLNTFISHPKRVLTRDDFLEMAHHQRCDPFDRSVDIRINRLRKKIEIDPAKPRVLRTVRCDGYRLVPDSE